MAEVYRAYHVSLDRYVAIKVLHAFLADDPEFKTRFEKEARNIARLKHNNIVQVYDFENEPESESYYMVMELVEGPTLKELLFNLNEQGTLMPLKEALRIVREAASALAYAHGQSMIHRDVKPANLMLDRDNRVVLTDFGIAKIVTGVQFTASGGMVGTPAYMAPEQGLGEAGDERSDLYSLGVILFQLVTGKLPYDAETPLAVILKHLNEPIPSARSLNPNLPESIDRIILQLMAKDPDDRYQSAAELIADLDRVERGEVVTFRDVGEVVVKEEPDEMDTRDLTPLSKEVRAAKAMQERRRTERGAPARGAPPRNRFPIWYWLIFGGIIVVGAALFLLSDSASPLLAFLSGSNTPTPTPTVEETPTEIETTVEVLPPTSTDTSTPTDIPTDTPTVIPTDTVRFTDTPSPLPPTRTPSYTPTWTFTPSDTPTSTYTPSVTPTPSITLTPTFDVTLTLLQATLFFEQQTATIAACDFDYRIVDQVPADGEFYLAGRPYTREITLQNTGTCAWERNTALIFVSGESLNATPPYFFIRERVNVGDTTTITFVGRTPNSACRQDNQVVMCVGVWELRTPGQILIGSQPIRIRVNVYEGG